MHADATLAEELCIQCPVCRATQAAQKACRRCNADLELFVHAGKSSLAARRRLTEAIAAGDAVAESRLRDYLQWLHG